MTTPWRTRARLMQSNLPAGDNVVLVCGGVWNETLRLPASGTAAKPVTVTASGTNCPAPPVIDGSVTLAPNAWTLHQGKVYKTALAGVPLQITATTTTTVWTEAHHPNRGYLASDPTSPYLSTAADSDAVTVNKAAASTSLFTGSDLVGRVRAALDR